MLTIYKVKVGIAGRWPGNLEPTRIRHFVFPPAFLHHSSLSLSQPTTGLEI